MRAKASSRLKQRHQRLKNHLREENPLLVKVVEEFQKLDKIGYKTGLLGVDDSFANRISWWPLISVLGTFSAGKSTFINGYLGVDLQKTGNQAVDAKFTVMTYSADDEIRILPGLSLDADPRFPFYQISDEIEKVSAGEGARIDSYLQLKTCHSEQLRGKILIDSPGFDADQQRTSTLRITDHIIDLSDLVLVFFDARHPEPGAMRDTLQHLVRRTLDRTDQDKFIFILNQIDTTAREDNLEDVVAAWQKAVVQAGLTAGTFYCHFSDAAAVAIEDETVKKRYIKRRDQDRQELLNRIEEVGVERVYRIVGSLESVANQIERNWIPQLGDLLKRWRKRVIVTDVVVFVLLVITIIAFGTLTGLGLSVERVQDAGNIGKSILVAVLVGAVVAIHHLVKKFQAQLMLRNMQKTQLETPIVNGFKKNTALLKSSFISTPAGWGIFSRKKLLGVREKADTLIQNLNDRYTDPSGNKAKSDPYTPLQHHPSLPPKGSSD